MDGGTWMIQTCFSNCFDFPKCKVWILYCNILQSHSNMQQQYIAILCIYSIFFNASSTSSSLCFQKESISDGLRTAVVVATVARSMMNCGPWGRSFPPTRSLVPSGRTDARPLNLSPFQAIAWESRKDCLTTRWRNIHVNEMMHKTLMTQYHEYD